MKVPGRIRPQRSCLICLVFLLPACSLQLPFVGASADQIAIDASTPPPKRAADRPAKQQLATLPAGPTARPRARPIAKPVPRPRWRSIPPSYEVIGAASWYGIPFDGRLTANGEIYDMNGLSAAHKTLPFGTRIRVTNLDNGSSLILRINDRGPFIAGRILDVSRRAAQLLGFQQAGLANVRIVMVPRDETARRR